MKRAAIACLMGLICLSACVSSKRFTRQLARAERKFNSHIGFILTEPGARKNLIEFNSNKYFTPASNTKIFTLYTALKVLQDSIPALKYLVSGDSLIFWGTGDPSFLYRNVPDNRVAYNFLKNAPQEIFFSNTNFCTSRFGAGWAWDDYPYAFSSERSGFPVFGNLIRIKKGEHDGQWSVTPPSFPYHLFYEDSIQSETTLMRDLDANNIHVYPGKTSTPSVWEIPFHWDYGEFIQILTDTLNRNVKASNSKDFHKAHVLYSLPADTLYRVMMQESDNFIAEQLLLLCAGQIADTLKPELAINYMQKNFFFDLPDKALWFDGSGLSRYNLFTPRTVSHLWAKIYQEVPQQRLFGWLATGGKTGTLKNWYRADSPYVFGKTGTLSNNHSLSGFLVSKKGKILIFSFMNSNFASPTKDVKLMMQDFLNAVRDKY